MATSTMKFRDFGKCDRCHLVVVRREDGKPYPHKRFVDFGPYTSDPSRLQLECEGTYAEPLRLHTA